MIRDQDLDELMLLYGRDGDPLWNNRVRPLVELALGLAVKFDEGCDTVSNAKIFLAYPDIARVASRIDPDPSLYAPLADPSLLAVPVGTFADRVRFLTPHVLGNLRPLVKLISRRLGESPRALWPSGITHPEPAPTLDPLLTRSLSSLRDYLEGLEPYSSLEELRVVESTPNGWLVWPRYRGNLLVFGGAQYFLGRDGGMLAAASVYSLQQLEKAYLAGERCSLIPPSEPEESPEAWARNSGPAARAVVDALNGFPEAAASGTLGHWENGQFADGETIGVMLRALGLSATPPLSRLEDLPRLVRNVPTGTHFVVGVRWKDSNRGHWFNVRNNGACAEWIDAQSGTSGSWPPPFLARAEEEGVVLRPLPPKNPWKLM